MECEKVRTFFEQTDDVCSKVYSFRLGFIERSENCETRGLLLPCCLRLSDFGQKHQ